VKRTDKIKLLEKVFLENDLSSLADAKEHGMVLYIRYDEGLKRIELPTIGNFQTLWNYSNDEAGTIKQQLLTKHNFVIAVGFDN
jgi:hypothetical protein